MYQGQTQTVLTEFPSKWSYELPKFHLPSICYCHTVFANMNRAHAWVRVMDRGFCS